MGLHATWVYYGTMTRLRLILSVVVLLCVAVKVSFFVSPPVCCKWFMLQKK